jgi:hypothetical protein
MSDPPAGVSCFHPCPLVSNAFPLSRLGAGWSIRRDCPFASRTACPRSCSPLLRSPCGDRHTSLRARASTHAPCGNAFPEATFRVAPTPSTTAVLATAAFHGPPPPSPFRVLGKRVPNSADMAHCLPLTAALSGYRNAATMPCFRSARATCPTRPEVGVPSELGLCRSLGCRSRCRANPATRLPPRGLTVPWLSLKKTARPLAGYARPHCRACKRL